MKRSRINEDGYVMVVVIVVMSFALVLGGVAVAETLRGRDGATQDVRGKRAQQAADAGLSAAIYRLNQIKLSNVNFSGGAAALSQGLACQSLLTFGTAVNVGFADVGVGSGTCGIGQPANPPGRLFAEELGDKTRADAYVTPGGSSTGSAIPTLAPSRLQPVVVSVGRDTNGTVATGDDVIRRVRAKLNPVAPFQAIEASGSLEFASNGLVTTTTLNGSAQANGDLKFTGGSLLTTFVNSSISVSPFNITGSVSYDGARTTSGLVSVNLATMNATTEPPVKRVPVTLSASKPDCPPTGCPTGYSSATHNLIATSGTVSFPGGDYVFCKVSLGSGTTIRPLPVAGKPVRIFVDAPSTARCAGNNADPNNGDIALTGRLDPGVTLQPSQLQIYVAGPASTPPTSATFDTTNSALALLPGFFFYGPAADTLLKYSTFQGNIIGGDVRLRSSGVAGLAGFGTFTQDLNINNLPLTSEVGVFSVEEYGECTAVEVTEATSANDC